MKKSIALLIVLSLIFVIVCTKSDKKNDIITIGWIGVLTGEAAPYGIAVKNGTDLAVDEINSYGGVKGKKIQIIYEDDKADPKTGINAMNKLLSVNKPPVIIQAAASSVMLANIPIAEANRVVYISPTCSNDKIKYGGNYIFRIWPADSYQGIFIAKYIFTEMNKIRAAILYINNDFGVGLKNAFQDEFTKQGGQIVSEQSFMPESQDMRTQLQKIKNANAEIIFIPSHVNETIRVLKQAKELGLDIPFFADAASFSEKLLNSSNNNILNNFYIVNLDWDINSNDPKIKNFISNFKNRYSQEPDIYAAAGYDLIYVLKASFENIENITSESIKNSLYNMDVYEGVTGRIKFDQYGEVEKEYSIYKYSDGNFQKILN